MTRVLSLVGMAFCGLALAACSPDPVASESSLPVVEVMLKEPYSALFESPPRDERKRWVKARYADLDGSKQKGSVALRGFSAWHHGPSKPSIRIKAKAKGKKRTGPKTIELSRPEDPLAICNWLPDQLGAELGLMHEHSSAVRLVLNGRDLGVYMRSLRPGNELCDAEGRPRGMFLKGDCLGTSRHFDLWQSSTSWDRRGEEDSDAIVALNELLAVLAQAPDATSLPRLGAVLDLEKTARMQAVASLVASIHADRVHNHVLFYDAAARRLEPLLWDANGFGIHAEPELAVDVARHPISERLLCHPEFVHRRNEVLWGLLRGSGSAAQMVATVDRRLGELDAAFVTDPEIARLVLRRGVFEAEAIRYEELPDARAAFVTFVERREAHLSNWFDDARVAFEPVPTNPAHSIVTVFGAVAVRMSRRDGAPLLTPDGRDASLLWPGVSAELIVEHQLRAADGHGVSAPHGVPAVLRYLVACPADQLRANNAFTTREITPSPVPESTRTRSVHPWQSTTATPVTPR